MTDKKGKNGSGEDLKPKKNGTGGDGMKPDKPGSGFS
jgi:hypothetical protein